MIEVFYRVQNHDRGSNTIRIISIIKVRETCKFYVFILLGWENYWSL